MDENRKRTAPEPGAKLIALDAVRGIAAFFVFAGHFCDGVTPGVTAALSGTPLYAVLNGPAAVVVFFVLSGFVLALAPLRSGWRAVFLLALKRWPRLAGPVTLASLAYYASANAGLMPEAARWAARVPQPPLFIFPRLWLDERSLGDVLREGLVTAYLRESAVHNPVLWTMHWEALGSALTMALVAILLARRLPIWLRAAAFVAVWFAAGRYSPWLIAFPVGVLGALWHRYRAETTRLPAGLSWPFLLVAGVLLSWDIRSASGLWAWTSALAFDKRIVLWMGAEIAAASILIASALYCAALRRLLSGRVGAFAGRLSFAFYLMHALAVFTVTAWLYVWWGHAGVLSGPGLFIVSTLAAIALSLPVMWFDQWWLRQLGAASRKVIPREAPKRP